MAEFKRTDNEKIVVTRSEYRGKKLIDIRTYYKDKDGEYQITKKGVQIPEERFNAFVKFLGTALDEGEEEEAPRKKAKTVNNKEEAPRKRRDEPERTERSGKAKDAEPKPKRTKVDPEEFM